MRSKLSFLILALSFTSLTGCMVQNGNALKRKAPVNTSDSGLLDDSGGWRSLTTGPGSDSNYICPTTSNVNPLHDWDFDAYHSNYYTVCRAKTDGTKLKIYGITKNSAVICAIPAVISVNANPPTYNAWIDPTLANQDLPDSAKLLDQCFVAKEDGVEISFGPIQFSHLFIVEKRFEDQMKECVYEQNYLVCPRYSGGEVN